MDKLLIPPGKYCYCIDYLRIPDMIRNISKIMETGEDIPITVCPYYTHKDINGTNKSYCTYIGDDYDYEFDLLLSDQCKICGENDEGNLTLESVLEYLVNLKTNENEQRESEEISG